MRKSKTYSAHVAVHKGTSIGRNPITSTMNKKKKASFKKYRGQGKRRWSEIIRKNIALIIAKPRRKKIEHQETKQEEL